LNTENLNIFKHILRNINKSIRKVGNSLPFNSHSNQIELKIDAYSRRADDEFGEGILGNQKLKKMYYLNVSESGIDSR
jgi:hypothetical protein